LGDEKKALSDDGVKGYQLFKTHCNRCHTEPLFTNHQFANVGLDNLYLDHGRNIITQLDTDEGKFKIPTQRNIMHTAPYMLDGRFSSIHQVIDHYRFHVKPHPYANSTLKNKLPFTDAEKNNLIQFLHILTDSDFLKKPVFNAKN
jgi:Cytochrome c peroxidase